MTRNASPSVIRASTRSGRSATAAWQCGSASCGRPSSTSRAARFVRASASESSRPTARRKCASAALQSPRARTTTPRLTWADASSGQSASRRRERLRGFLQPAQGLAGQAETGMIAPARPAARRSPARSARPPGRAVPAGGGELRADSSPRHPRGRVPGRPRTAAPHGRAGPPGAAEVLARSRFLPTGSSPSPVDLLGDGRWSRSAGDYRKMETPMLSTAIERVPAGTGETIERFRGGAEPPPRLPGDGDLDRRPHDRLRLLRVHVDRPPQSAHPAQRPARAAAAATS